MDGDIYKEVKVIKFDNAVARVYIPDLNEEERNRRLKQIHKAAVNLLIESERKVN